MPLTYNPNWPDVCKRSELFKLFVDGQQVSCLEMSVAHHASFEFTGSVTIELVCKLPVEKLCIKPLSKAIKSERSEYSLKFTLDKPQYLCIEDNGAPSFFLYAMAPEDKKPDPNTPGLITFEPGKAYDVGLIELKDNSTLHIPLGAFVQGVVKAENASNITISGRGILDGLLWRQRTKSHHRQILLSYCKDILVKDILITETAGWSLVLGDCDRVHVDGLRILGKVVGGDGIDVVASRNVTVERCCIRTNDDCLVIKAFNHNWRSKEGAAPLTDSPSYNLRFSNCILWNDGAGNAIEIGHELHNKEIYDVIFSDIDILCVHGHGAPISINHAATADLHDVLYENIRIEHYYDSLLSIRFSNSRYGFGYQGQGKIRDITLRNIYVHSSVFNPGYSFSIIGGWNESNPVENILIENMVENGKHITHGDQIDLFTRYIKNVEFR